MDQLEQRTARLARDRASIDAMAEAGDTFGEIERWIDSRSHPEDTKAALWLWLWSKDLTPRRRFARGEATSPVYG